jgi:transcriptional regulator with XRE-family HTH domain
VVNRTDPARPGRDVEPTIGERIRHLRGDMTQAALAAASGVSVDYIRKLEQGRRHTVSITTLHKIARALDLDTGALMTKPRRLDNATETSGAVAIRRTLTSVGDLTGEDHDVEQLSVADGRRAITLGWGAYWGGRYDQLGQILPTAIERARAALRAVPAAEQPAARDVAAQTLGLSAATLVHLGYTDIAHLALREALDHAASGVDPLRVDALRCTLSWLLLVEGRFPESARLATVTAEALAPTGDTRVPAWAMYGSLLVTAATSTGRAGNRAGALDLLDEAGKAADVTGNRSVYEMAFGPDQVAMQRVDVETVTENYGGALAAAKLFPQDSQLPLVARARHLSDVALAHTRLGNDGAALDVLETMVRMAPVWARWQEQPKMIVRELQARARTPRRLTELARTIGVTED